MQISSEYENFCTPRVQLRPLYTDKHENRVYLAANDSSSTYRPTFRRRTAEIF